MSAFTEVLKFGREYLNKPQSRTKERKSIVREAYWAKFGRKIRGKCPLCYVQAILEILKYDPMAAQNYRLKRGVIAVQFFGEPDKTITPANLTDERGDWVLKNHPEKLVYFDQYPRVPVARPGIKKVAKPEVYTKNPPKQIVTPQNEALRSKLDALAAVSASINQPPEYDEVKPKIEEKEPTPEKVEKPKTTAKKKSTKKKTTVRKDDSFGNKD